MAEASDEKVVRHFCTCRLAGQLFGFDIRAVKEVTTQTTFTPIPHAPASVHGYVNLRGHIYLVLDLRLVLGLEPAPVTADSRLLIFKSSTGESFGVLVDQIGDIVTLKEEQVESWRPEEGGRSSEAPTLWATELVEGIGKLESELVVLLAARKLLGVIARVMEERYHQGERGTPVLRSP
jgi:chemotaxis signal transduction protein